MPGKSYEDLRREVWDTGRCCGCGACVAVCPADALIFTAEENTHPVNRNYCKEATDGVPCGACYDVCPRVKIIQGRGLLGEFRSIISAKAGIAIPHRQSGGAVTAILADALDNGLIDAVVCVAEDRFTLKPESVVITSSGELIKQAGSRYAWWVPLLTALKTAVLDKKCRKIAVVGLPCVTEAVAEMKAADNDLIRPYAHSIRLVFGLFCTETFDYDHLVNDLLGHRYHIQPYDVEKLDMKKGLLITKTSGEMITIPIKELSEAVRPGCRICTDLTARSADISAGSVGSDPGYTTLIIRSEAGEAFVQSAIASGALLIEREIDESMIESLASKKAARGIPRMSSHHP
ncbi:hypothetical protein FTO68_10155 [Methanocalculus taiwanensis]|uniref:4Fe-4S ferredoxin-type domain-containing protein n=1 Tax=Methanocalculus taiwanensis TaxID=106207 RepID=A0ABD4TM08_9EURY|nr:hypothetical protein [Methanocalculus taiwanensis]